MGSINAIHHDLIIQAPIHDVFKSITEPIHLVNWWPLSCTGIPTLGSEYNFYFTSEYDWYGKVSKIISDQSFYIKMT